MAHGRLIEYEGQMGETFRYQVSHPAAAHRARQTRELPVARAASRQQAIPARAAVRSRRRQFRLAWKAVADRRN